MRGIVLAHEPRIVAINEFRVEFALNPSMIFILNKDKQGVLSFITTVLSNNGINIANLDLARGGEGAAVTIISLDSAPSKKVLQELSDNDLVIETIDIHL